LANEPSVLLADEPTGNLDRRNSQRVADIFAELSEKGQAIVMVTHDQALAQRAPRMITMEDGLLLSDTASEGQSDKEIGRQGDRETVPVS
jgi:ABC-type lipoprotein export system ATPase subunit